MTAQGYDEKGCPCDSPPRGCGHVMAWECAEVGCECCAGDCYEGAP